jgi:hypothetical protein
MTRARAKITAGMASFSIEPIGDVISLRGPECPACE